MRFKGWKPIFAFTYLQQVKSKGFIASTIIVCVLIIAIAVLIGVLSFSELGDTFGGGDGTDGGNRIDTLYICNETDIPEFDSKLVDFSIVSVSTNELPEVQERVKSGDKAEAVLHIIYENGNEGGDVRLKLYRPMDETLVGDDYMDELAYTCRTLFRKALLMNIGVAESDVELAQTAFSSDISVYGEELSEIREMLNIVIPMLFAAVMFMFIISYAQIIAQSVAMEKTSRVIELLITSVRPLAIVMGKVFAMLLVVLTQLVVIGTVTGGTVAVFSMVAMSMGGMEAIGAGMDTVQEIGEAIQASDISWQAEIARSMPGLFDPLSMVMIVIIFLLGFLFYALLAALIGAGISRSEDLATGMQPLALISMVGFFLSYMPSAFNAGYGAGGGEVSTSPDVLTVVARYLPISSPFALPSGIILGQMGAVEIVIATLILAVLTFGTMMLVAKVYENIILYSGSALKLGQIIKMAKSK